MTISQPSGGGVTADVARAILQAARMNGDELSQAIPAAYTQFIGEHLLEHLASVPS